MSSLPFDWANPWPAARLPVFARDLVATSQPLAAQAGLLMLAQGGNAIDAAVAAAAVITLAEPVSCGLGSDAFAIVWDGQRLHGLNGSGFSPSAWSLDSFQRKYGDKPPQRGWDSVTVPGAVASWAALHARFGQLPFDVVMAPAIDYAHRGVAVSAVVQRKWAAQIPVLRDQPGFAEHFMPHGRAPQVGEHFVLKGAAATLERIAATRGRDLYEGQTAEALVAHSKAHGGSLALGDLAGFQPEWVDPLSMPFAGHEVHELPPNGQGIAALIALGIVERLGLAPDEVNTAHGQHLLVEAMKLGFAETYAHVGDPQHMGFAPQRLLDGARLDELARRIDSARAQEPLALPPPAGGTIYLCTADRQGRMVSFIQSNYLGFGSGVVVPGTGVSLQNRGSGFTMTAGHANAYGPRKRPFHTIIPGFLTHDGAPQMAFGVMGGNMQPQGHVQTLVRMLLGGEQPQAACDAARWKWNRGTSLDIESSMPADIRDGLAARGHRLETIADPYMDFGSGQFIWRLGDPATDGYVGASDSRRDGLVAGI